MATDSTEAIATPFIIPLHVARRSTKRLMFFFETEDDDGVISAYQIPSGSTTTFTVRTSQADNSALAYSGVGTLISAVSGQVEVVIPKSALMGFPHQRTPHYYELRLVEDDGEEFPWFAGAFYIHPTAAAPG